MKAHLGTKYGAKYSTTVKKTLCPAAPARDVPSRGDLRRLLRGMVRPRGLKAARLPARDS